MLAEIMRFPRPKKPWSRLVVAARAVSDEGEYIFVPYGFSARVAALALGRPPTFIDLTEAYAGRALAASWMLAALSVLLNYDPSSSSLSQRGDQAAGLTFRQKTPP
jgi:hypothetical protein